MRSPCIPDLRSADDPRNLPRRHVRYAIGTGPLLAPPVIPSPRNERLRPHRVSGRAGGDRAQLLLHRGRRPHPARRLRDHVPRRRHARRRPRASRLHLPAGERRPRRGDPAHARPRGPRGRHRVPPAGRRRTGLRVGPLARAGAQPHRGSGHARPHRADPGDRRRTPPHRSDRLPVHPGHALRARGLRDRVLHARRHDHPQRRLQARPHAGRRPAHEPRAPRRHREPRGWRATPHGRLDERRASGLHAVGVDGRRRDAVAVPRVPRQAVHRHELRVAPAPGAAGRAGRDRQRPQDRVRRPVDAAEHHDGARARLHRHSRPRGDRHRRGAQARARRGVHRVHRFAG